MPEPTPAQLAAIRAAWPEMPAGTILEVPQGEPTDERTKGQRYRRINDGDLTYGNTEGCNWLPAIPVSRIQLDDPREAMWERFQTHWKANTGYFVMPAVKQVFLAVLDFLEKERGDV